jgi:acetyltransferase
MATDNLSISKFGGALSHRGCAHYPAQWACIGTTRDNVNYRIRPIRVDDAARERAFLLGLSAESRYLRMMYAMGEPPCELVDRFVHVDYHQNMAFVAVIGEGDEERIIGVARYAADNEEGHEFAIAIADAWQGRGIAATLSQLLFDYARSEGIHTIYASILASNHRMIEFAHWLGMTVRFSPKDGMILKASKDL